MGAIKYFARFRLAKNLLSNLGFGVDRMFCELKKVQYLYCSIYSQPIKSGGDMCGTTNLLS
jgi:hypothetical protein